MKKIYLFSPTIKYKAFKKVMDKFPDKGIMPMNIDKILWELLRDKRLYIFLDGTSDDPVSIDRKSVV